MAMHPNHWAQVQPSTPAVIMAGSGESVSYGTFNTAINQSAQLLRRLGLRRGDVFAVWSGNNPRYLEIAWAMRNAGLYMVPISARLRADEAAYIVNDSKARVLIIDAGLAHSSALVEQLPDFCPGIEVAFSLRGELYGLQRWEEAVLKMPEAMIDDPLQGRWMAYSSGTTGRPKGVQHPLPAAAFDDPPPFAQLMAARYGSRPQTQFVVSAPLYHAGTMGFTMAEIALGSTLLVFEKFDAEDMLKAIARYRPERGQFVPTMFVRLLKLPPEVRQRYDVSSLKFAIHSAGPCSIDTKRAMIDWWGPILDEIYGGTENVGSTMINSTEWLRKPGSVGKASRGSIHICDDDGNELPVGLNGTIFFDADSSFQYLGDAEKTQGSRHPRQSDWASFGDIGRVDEDGYLFLSDRKAFMIICGGVNIYPQEVENVLIQHPDIADATVFGIPDLELGEQIKAVVELADPLRAGAELEAELISYCRSKLSGLKCPKSIDFLPKLPRDDAGKLAKKTLRDRYWPSTG